MVNQTQSGERVYAFMVDGTPAPQGSKRHVGNGRLIESSKKLKPWRDAVKAAAADEIGSALPIQEPVELKVTFYFLRPKTVKRSVPSVRPDLDKLVRALLDGLTDGRMFNDDALVVSLTASKQYAEFEGADITVRGLSEVAA